jgi:tetratricopeptide (TPR) repeat protein
MYDVAITQKYTSEGTDVKKFSGSKKSERKSKPAAQVGRKESQLLIEQCKQKPTMSACASIGENVDGRTAVGTGRAVYEAALEMAPDNARILEALVEVYDELGRTEDADSMLNLLADARPEDQELKKKILDRQIARVTAPEAEPSAEGVLEEAKAPDPELERLKQERLEIEIADYRQKIKDNPANPDLHLQLGKMLRSKGDLDEAVRSFQTASRNPTRAFLALKLLGETFYEKGMLEIAVEQLDRAIERSASTHRDFLTHDMKEIHYTLSRIYEDLDDLDKAIEYLQPIYEEDLNFKDVQTRFEQLYQKRTAKRKQKAESENSEE